MERNDTTTAEVERETSRKPPQRRDPSWRLPQGRLPSKGIHRRQWLETVCEEDLTASERPKLRAPRPV